MMMQCTKTTRFSSSGFSGMPQFDTTNNGSRPRDPPHGTGRRSAVCVFSLRVDPRDTTNKRSLSVIVERTLREQKVEGRGFNNKATPNFRGRSKIAGSTDSVYKSE